MSEVIKQDLKTEALKLAREWIGESPERRTLSAGKMVALLTEALAEQPAQPSKPWVGLSDIEIQNCFQPRSKDKTKERRLIAEQIVKKVLEKLV